MLLTTEAANAHLLNMSKSSVSIAADGNVSIALALDLLVTAGSRETYWAWSQLERPLDSEAVSAALAPLPAAIALSANGTLVRLQLQSLTFPKLTKDEYLDPLSWPRAKITLGGQIPLPATQSTTLPTTLPTTLQVSYTDGFRFEEPIANTLIDEQAQRKQTRWLVTGQRSPDFLLQSAIAAPGTPSADVSETDSLTPKAPFATDTRNAETTEAKAVFADLLIAGFRHIFPDGMDHLLFVAALFFGSASLAGLVGIITLFTLAHSLSLGMTALGWISAPAAIVEPLILLSILWVAIANLVNNTRLHASYLMVLLFGLVHGLGFASALRDIGLPSDFLLTGLAAFNVGVEAAQLTFLLMLAAAMFVIRISVTPLAAWRRYGSLAVIFATLLLMGFRFL